MMIDKDLAVPGDFITDDPRLSGDGTYVGEGKVYATRYGIIEVRDKIRIVPLFGKYIPRRGDEVIGKVIDINEPYWLIDIGSPYQAKLHASEVGSRPWEMLKHIKVGDVVFAKVKKVELTSNIDLAFDSVLRKGRLIQILPTRVPRIIGKRGSMVNMIKEKCGCSVLVGHNGLIWIDGDGAELARRAILMIERDAHTSGLTDRVAEFLENEANPR